MTELGADVATALLKAGAAPDAHTGWGWTQLHCPGDRQLISAVTGNAPLSGGQDGGPEVIEALARAGAGLDDRDRGGRAPLHLAAIAGATNAVASRLACGSGTAARDRDGRTALHLAAATNRNIRVIDLMVKAGANHRLRDRFGRAPIHIAAESSESITVVSAPATTREDANMRDSTDATPLHLAAQNGNHPAIIDVLLASGADPAVGDGAGQLPVDVVGRLAPVRTSDACWKLHDARYG